MLRGLEPQESHRAEAFVSWAWGWGALVKWSGTDVGACLSGQQQGPGGTGDRQAWALPVPPPFGVPMAPTLAPWCEGQVMSGPGLGSDSLPPWSIWGGVVHSSSGVSVGEVGAPSAGSQACPAGGEPWFRLPKRGWGEGQPAAGGLATQPPRPSGTPWPSPSPGRPLRPPIRRSRQETSGARPGVWREEMEVSGNRRPIVACPPPAWPGATPVPFEG